MRNILGATVNFVDPEDMCNNEHCECEDCTCDPCTCSEENPCGCE